MHLTSIIALFTLVFGLLQSSIAPAATAAVTGPTEEITGYGPIRAGSGWLVTPSRLFLTLDEGRAWREITPALGGLLLAADFLVSGEGWLVAGAPSPGERSELTLARSEDLGATWRLAPLSLFSSDDPDPTIAEVQLDFADARHGVVRVRHVSSSNFEHWSKWRTADGGQTWERDGLFAPYPDQKPARDDVRHLAGGYGWELQRTGQCVPTGSGKRCHQVVGLRRTGDGGITWKAIPLPAGVGGEREWTTAEFGATAAMDAPAAAVAGGSRTAVVTGQGFDKCEIARPYELDDWRVNSPYSAVNLYIGGAVRACSNRALSADYLGYLFSRGWTFVPTWVGPQAPCWPYGDRVISSDPAAAQGQGWTEANAAADRLAQLGLTEVNGTGSIVYYDMEHYNTADQTCSLAVQSFVVGWVGGLHSRGNLAGVYSNGDALSQLANLPQRPDAIWPAHSIYPSYNAQATVWNVYRLGNDLWVNSQRLRQYTKGHNETWGASTLNIDADVLNGVVAVMGPVTPAATPTVTPTATPTSTPTPTPTATPTFPPFTPTAWLYLPLLTRP